MTEVGALRAGFRQWEANKKKARRYPTVDMLDVVDIMLATGARISETLAIRWKDIDLKAARPTVTVNGNRLHAQHVTSPGSSGSPRIRSERPSEPCWRPPLVWPSHRPNSDTPARMPPESTTSRKRMRLRTTPSCCKHSPQILQAPPTEMRNILLTLESPTSFTGSSTWPSAAYREVAARIEALIVAEEPKPWEFAESKAVGFRWTAT